MASNQDETLTPELAFYRIKQEVQQGYDALSIWSIQNILDRVGDTEANRLRKAAPLLLLALKRIMAYLEIHDSMFYEVNADAEKARRAIAQAEGGEER